MKDNLVSIKTDSGVPIYHSEGNADLVSYQVIVKAGSRYEPIDGISHIMEHMNFKGTENRTKDETEALVDGYGGYFNASTGHDWISYEVRGHSDGADDLLDVITDMVCFPSVKESELIPEKKVILQELAMRDNDPTSHFYGMVASNVWRGSSLEHKVIGDAESIGSVDSGILKDFHRDMFVRENVAVISAGKVGLDKIAEKTDDTIGTLKHGKRSGVSEIRLNDGILAHESSERNKSCYAALAYPFVLDGYETESLDVLGMILCSGLSSRLYKELRDRKSLIYNVTPPRCPFLGCGMFMPGFASTPENVVEAIGCMAEVLGEVKKNGVTETEVRNAKMKNSFSLQTMYESTKDRAKAMMYDYWANETVHTLEETESFTDSVTCESVLAVAQKVMDRRKMHLIVYGTDDDGIEKLDLAQIDV